MLNLGKQCQACGRKLGLFSSGPFCADCASRRAVRLADTERDIVKTKLVTADQAGFLAELPHPERVGLYRRILSAFLDDRELEETELTSLGVLQDHLELTSEEAQYTEVIMPHIYLNAIRSGHLPAIALDFEGSAGIVLRKGEVVHAYCPAIYQELRSVVTGYSGGSRGVSIRIMKGVRYHVGGHRGHVLREERLQEVSRGVLILTDRRLFLHPMGGGRRTLSIPIAKIQSYACYENALELYKDGREKGHYFVSTPGFIEVMGLCFGHLLQNED